jgi:hypothetical protein
MLRIRDRESKLIRKIQKSFEDLGNGDFGICEMFGKEIAIERLKARPVENLLHCLDDTKSLLKGLKNILSEDGKMYFTTLVKGNRFADRYLEALAKGGKLVSRDISDHQTTFDQLGMTIKCIINGNLASINYGD